ncbi:MBL fold metallo-hydrolase [Colwellia sp. M166]|uniref:MBL fold metallo-hydrolase n=1 Tax=Colwellia sp. M166 TaxID=2583805 RepID=UPI00211F1346|nr:MBL fold metallo-hydrolase [Colwellia sp. M166]UUO22689.1 MBL fold metallo-hydrolase [Colwellia sp. M166]|tara:strand:- start:76 stop:936 length:861 start_codon:yes stop_codon:yes gene_type:complete
MLRKSLVTLALLLGVSAVASVAAQDMADANITVQPAAGDVYMLQGPGGNIGVLATEKGLLLVDDKFASLAEKIEFAMKGIEDNELKYVINTHYHGDHTGSNQFFAHKAPIFAHENVRNRLSSKAGLSAESLPVVTYKDGITIYLDNEEVQLTHLPAGHTDGDTYVYFKNANVLHTGDLFFEVGFPYVDLKSGGSIKGYLASVRHMIANTPDDVVIIPGHGKLTNKKRLVAFAEMMAYSIDKVSKALAAGKSEADIVAQGIGEKYQHLSWSFITEEKWLKTLIADLK